MIMQKIVLVICFQKVIHQIIALITSEPLAKM